MRSNKSMNFLASLLAVFIASSALAEELADQSKAEETEKELVREVEPGNEEQEANAGAETVAEVQDASEGDTQPAAEPEAVVKTKTKSNQSND